MRRKIKSACRWFGAYIAAPVFLVAFLSFDGCEGDAEADTITLDWTTPTLSVAGDTLGPAGAVLRDSRLRLWENGSRLQTWLDWQIGAPMTFGPLDRGPGLYRYVLLADIWREWRLVYSADGSIAQRDSAWFGGARDTLVITVTGQPDTTFLNPSPPGPFPVFERR